MTGIAEMFAELSWRRADYERALEEWSAWHAARDAERRSDPRERERRRLYRSTPEARAAAVERVRRWRQANRDKVRARSARQAKQDRMRAKIDPVFGAKYRARKNEQQKRKRRRNPEKYRAYNREAKRRERARKRAEMQVAA